eukprot:331768-Hanusia_phi.AAC.6
MADSASIAHLSPLFPGAGAASPLAMRLWLPLKAGRQGTTLQTLPPRGQRYGDVRLQAVRTNIEGSEQQMLT